MDIGESLTKTFKLPISYLDYDYIEKCTNILELEKIYLTLRTGEEGKYCDLENFCEERLKKLCPNSRVLRKPTELISLNQLDGSIQEEIINDFESWVVDMQSVDSTMKKSNPSDNGDNNGYTDIPIRSKNNIDITIKDETKSSLSPGKKSCKPKDYNEWSKIANELEKQMILEDKNENTKLSQMESKIEKKQPKDSNKLEDKIDTSKMTKLEKENVALNEKNKGNEAFKSGDFSEAIIYYSRSLSVEPIAAVYNNRGLVYMKQEKWEEALKDLSVALKKDPDNIKALQRRATCYSEVHNLPDAITDCRKILKLNPNNKFAENLLSKSLQELEKRAQPKLKDGRRMVITEIESDDESSDEGDDKRIIEEKFTDVTIVENKQIDKENEEVAGEIKVIDQSNQMTNDEELSENQFLKLKDRGNQLFKELKYDEALRIYDQLVEGWPSNPIGYRNRAACNLVLERPFEVINDCSKAVELDKDSHLSYYRRGKAYKILKMFSESFADLEKALEISPNHSQIKDELNEVKMLLEQANATQNNLLSSNEVMFTKESDNMEMHIDSLESESFINEETICVSNIDDQEVINPDGSNTWEFLGLPDLVDYSDQSGTSDSIVTLQKSTNKLMTKCEFDRQLNNIRLKCSWKSTIKLLMDAGPSNLSSLIGTKLDGFILENILSSLLEYSKNKEHVNFIKTVLQELTKVQRFCFVKMMISDHTLSELDQLFKYLRHNNNNLAEIDCLEHKYQ